MKMIRVLLLFFTLYIVVPARAQMVHFADSARVLTQLKLKTNRHGMHVLGAWGVVNIGEGLIGYATAKEPQWKYFNEMNAIWGVVNAGIVGAGLAGIRKQMDEQLDCGEALHQYEGIKRLYLINMGLDVVYAGVGVYLTQQAQITHGNADELRGFGRSLMMQGAFLFVFDNVMYASHQRRNSAWYHLLQGVCVTGNGVGFIYHFNPRSEQQVIY